MKVTILGSGTSQGIPVIACECDVCTSIDPRDRRLRSSVWIEVDGKSIVIDSGPDFRYQMLRAGVMRLDALLLTHEHKDHIAGMDDIRAFNYKQGAAINIYAHTRVQEALKREFTYIFSGDKYPGIPQIELHDIDKHPFEIRGLTFTPIEVMHYKMPVLGYRIGDFTYITDAKTVTDEEKQKIIGTKILVINALQKEKHLSHFTLEEALAFAAEIGAEQTYFTHISHKLGKHDEISASLPEGIYLAYDGLILEI